ncbi:hypothetical protein K1T71_013192 [Dendrolimus kikuchii]|uniref:Uncharacterized protein n=1 Tax=Dendrolimus kikuchii TaxID=765133 RepID=A0ACC1CJG6_9NEOP|nr:hypothetical protein K1T71_013192 [Dendrolimus kikuchii]
MAADGVKPMEFLVQALSAACICFLGCQTGYVCAWPSYTVANFTSNSSALSRPMTALEISLLGSLPNVGALVTSPFCGFVFNTFGRKYATILFGLPYVLAWTTISMTSDVHLVLAAMTVAGVGIAGQNVSLIYISEIAHDSIRGGLITASASAYFLGLLVSYALGGHLSYMQVVYAHLALAVLCVALLALMKESPVYLVMLGKEAEAAEAIAFYKRVSVPSKEVEAEIAKIKLQLDPDLESKLQSNSDPEEGSDLMKKKGKQSKKESQWRLLRRSRSSQRALATTLVVIGATVAMGSVVLQVYAEPLFAEATPSMPANRCSIFLALDFLIASVLCALVIDRFGRKFLLIATSLGSGACTLALGVQLQLAVAPPWVTALLIYLYSFVYTLGCAVVPFVLASEVFLPEVRGLCNGISMGFVWVVTFLTLVVFNPLVDALGLGPVFYCFSAICFFGALYGHFCVPETKGLSPDQIQALFLKTK